MTVGRLAELLAEDLDLTTVLVAEPSGRYFDVVAISRPTHGTARALAAGLELGELAVVLEIQPRRRP